VQQQGRKLPRNAHALKSQFKSPTALSFSTGGIRVVEIDDAVTRCVPAGTRCAGVRCFPFAFQIRIVAGQSYGHVTKKLQFYDLQAIFRLVSLGRKIALR
jgi:hypothetical protein